MDMEEGLREVIDAICMKEVHELTDTDKAVIRARRDYLDRFNKRKFADILNEQPTETKSNDAAQKGNEQSTPAVPFSTSDDDGVDE